jgi:hypothetical protein
MGTEKLYIVLDLIDDIKFLAKNRKTFVNEWFKNPVKNKNLTEIVKEIDKKTESIKNDIIKLGFPLNTNYSNYSQTISLELLEKILLKLK